MPPLPKLPTLVRKERGLAEFSNFPLDKILETQNLLLACNHSRPPRPRLVSHLHSLLPPQKRLHERILPCGIPHPDEPLSPDEGLVLMGVLLEKMEILDRVERTLHKMGEKGNPNWVRGKGVSHETQIHQPFSHAIDSGDINDLGEGPKALLRGIWR